MIIPFSKSIVESSPHNYSLQCTLWVACDYSITLCVCLCYEWGPALFAPVSPCTLSLSYVDTTEYSRSPVRWAVNHTGFKWGFPKLPRMILMWTTCTNNISAHHSNLILDTYTPDQRQKHKRLKSKSFSPLTQRFSDWGLISCQLNI